MARSSKRIYRDPSSLLLNWLHGEDRPWLEQRHVLVPRHYAAFGVSDTGGLRTPDESEESDGISIYEPIDSGEICDSSRMDVDSIS